MIEMTAVNDPDASITDMATLPPRPLAPTALTVNELEDVHKVDAVDDPPTRPLPDTGMFNAIEPTTVTLILPDVATLVGSSDEMDPPLYVITTVTVPTCVPAVTAALRDGDAPDATLDCTEVSDVHTVVMLAEPPMRPAPLRSAEPPISVAPTTVTVMAPVVATLVTTMLLSSGPSDVNAAVSVLCITAEVTIARSPTFAFTVVFTDNADEEVHDVAVA